MLFKALSSIHGFGVFTEQDLKKGQPICNMGTPPLLRPEEVTDEMKVMQIDDELYSGESGTDLDYINHSCSPNCGFTDGSTILHALRDIKAGEELFWDYSSTENEKGWIVPCDCGAKNCRGKIQSFCELSEEVQDRLLPNSLNYIRRWYDNNRLKKQARA